MSLTYGLSIAGLLLWVGFEILFRRRDDPDAASWSGAAEDKHSTQVLMCTYVLSIVGLMALESLGIGTAPIPWRWAGVAGVATGLALRAWGMTALGRFYTRTLRVADDQQVVEGGPYRLIRHPGYAGSLLVWIGYCLGIGNWVAALVAGTLLAVAYGWRITSEEAMLVAHFGERYREYQRRTDRLVPFVY